MASNPGFGKRLGERLREMGYWLKDRGVPDCYRFGLAFRHNPSAAYRWLQGEVPRTATFLRLAQELQRPPHYLLTGSASPTTTGGTTGNIPSIHITLSGSGGSVAVNLLRSSR